MEKTKILPRIDNMVDRLNHIQSIPSEYELILEDRLVLVCKPPQRLNRKKEPRSKSEYSAHARLKRARETYMEVLESAPSIFVPFILVVSPNACRTWKASEIRERLSVRDAVRLGDETRAKIEEIARKRDINQTAVYRRLRALLFVSPPKPTTVTKTADLWIYDAANVDVISKLLNEDICGAIECSPRRVREKENQFLKTTQCIQMAIPRPNQSDAIVRLDVGFNCELIKALFPTAWEKLASLHGLGSLTQSTEHIYDNGYFTLQGASISDISTIFGSQIYRAIEESQLREWEASNLLLKTTDCVVLDISRTHPFAGVMCLRLGFAHGVTLATQLYSDGR
ncbi:hypothetical protein BJX66DRAFT_317156 [Aspergillus keveii]|uniref:Uncharacterized protein n=1 Tax=Aspergillus keveii TaxID=714993 RepID=A0ABR4FLN1_9EURO